MALTLDGTNGIVSSGSITTQSATGVIFSDSSSLPAASSPFSLKNRIINGDMVIDQRNAGASVTPTAGGYYTVDRFWVQLTQASKFSIQQQTSVVPTGFTNSVKVTSLATTSLAAGDYYTFQQSIEGYNIADLAWGTASAKTVTLSFQVYSSLTGTFGGSLTNSAFNRAYPFTYTVSSANTWTTISVTIAGDTTGTWLTTSGIGIQVIFGLGVGTTYSGTAGSWGGTGYLSATGAVSVVGTNGATFYITGVQLERNTTATPFEWLPYSTELALCQRYYYKTFGQEVAPVNGAAYTNGIGVPAIGTAYTTSSVRNQVVFPQPMRTTPTVTYFNSNVESSPTADRWFIYVAGTWTNSTSISSGEVSPLYVSPNVVLTGLTRGYSYLLSGFLTASAEL